MHKTNAIRVLLLASTAEEAEQTLILIKNHGVNVRPKFIPDFPTLGDNLNKQVWDLCIYHENCANITAIKLINYLQIEGKDIPVIVLADDISERAALPLIKVGINSICKKGENNLFMAVLERKIESLEKRRELKALEYSLQEKERQYEMLVHTSRAAIAYVMQEKIIYTNPAFVSLFGYTSEGEMQNLTIKEIIAQAEEQRIIDIINTLPNDANTPYESIGRTKSSSNFGIELSAIRSMYKNKPCIQLIIRAKVSNSITDSTYIEDLENRDLITNLYNKQFFMNTINKHISLKMTSTKSDFVFYLEVSNFNVVKKNDGLGQSDLVISDIAKKLTNIINKPGVKIARYAEATFTIMLPNQDKDKALELAEDITAKLNKYILERVKPSYQLSFAIGVCVINALSANPQDVMAKANSAYIKAKEGISKIYFHEIGLDKKMVENDKHIITELEKAISEGRLNLLYQPILSLHAEGKEYYEVFLRMQNAEGKVIRPESFFPKNLEDQVLAKIDRWVIERATKILSEQRLQGHNTFLFIKISGQSLLDTSLPAWISATLKAARVPSDALVFDINEDDIATRMEQAQLFIKHLKELHANCCIYKFGRGLNSFGTIEKLEAKFIKLDGSFSEDILKKEGDALQRLQQVVETLHTDGRLVILPKVESAQIMPVVWKAKVNYVEGYYIQAPSLKLDYNFSIDDIVI